MLWKWKPRKRIAIVCELGQFTWDGHFSWECDWDQKGDPIHLIFIGERFEVSALPRFKHALSNLPSLVAMALEASSDEIAAWQHNKNEMSLIGVTVDPDEKAGDYQLDFAFDNWPDGGLTVHFKDGVVVGSHVDD